MADTPEVYIASSNAPWAMLNMAFLPKPVETEAELARSVAAAVSRLASHKAGWIYVACEDWLEPGLREKAPAILEAHGLKRTMNAMGMVAERLLPPTRSLPAIEVRHATDVETLRHIADVNSIVYGSPLEVARESIVNPALFQGDCRGYVGFAEGKAISVAAVMRIEGIAYVGFVATLAEYRGRGFAEAVMRHGLGEARQHWGLERTVLHATDAGHPTYLRMGYRDVTNFGFYMPVPGQ